MTQVVTSVPAKIALERKLSGITRPLVLLSCEQSYRKLRIVNDLTMAEAFRQSWFCQPLKQPHPPEVALCHVKGVVRKVYKDVQWHRAVDDLREDARRLASLTPHSAETRRLLDELVDQFAGSPGGYNSNLWNFTANEAPEYEWLLGLDLSDEVTRRGMSNPVRYVNCD